MATPGVIILDDPPAGITYTQKKGWRERVKIRLGSQSWQWFIIALVITDACLVATDIILANVYCSEAHPPHSVEVVEDLLRYASISILSFFALEWLLEAFVHGFHRWVRTPLHMIDLIIVTISLVLEVVAVALGEVVLEIGGLLVIFRLWRVVRVMHAVGEVEHKAHEDLHSNLDMANLRLQQISEAHHAVIKEMHREYTHRLNSLIEKNEALMEKNQAHAKAARETAPTLDEMLRTVSQRSAELRRSVTLHRQSLAHVASHRLGPHNLSLQNVGSTELPPVALGGIGKITED